MNKKRYLPLAAIVLLFSCGGSGDDDFTLTPINHTATTPADAPGIEQGESKAKQVAGSHFTKTGARISQCPDMRIIITDTNNVGIDNVHVKWRSLSTAIKFDVDLTLTLLSSSGNKHTYIFHADPNPVISHYPWTAPSKRSGDRDFFGYVTITATDTTGKTTTHKAVVYSSNSNSRNENFCGYY